MRYLSIELVGFRRMALRNIKVFRMTMQEIVQLILGTNGCGKSSLINELTPLPADPTAYHKTGSKTLTLTDKGSTYVLKSWFSHGNKHSFEKDGVELNTGHTQAAQRELVKQTFGITPAVDELIKGIERFHSMPPGKRREWFTKLADVDYDYALRVFKKLQELARDKSGALKEAKRRLVAESAKLISDTEEKKLRAELEVTHRELTYLIEQRAPIEKPAQSYREERDQNLEELQRLSGKLRRMKLVAPYTHLYGIDLLHGYERNEWGDLIAPAFTSLADIDALLEQYREAIAGKEALLNQAVTEHTKNEETIAILTKTGEAGFQALQTKMDDLRLVRDQHLARRKLGIEGIDPVHGASALESVFDVLEATFTALPENTEKKYSQTNLQSHQQRALHLQDKQAALQRELAKLNAQLQHLESHKAAGAMQCPKCQHRWHPGADEAKLQLLRDQITSTEAEHAILTKEHSEVAEKISAIQAYSQLYRDYLACVRNWPVLTPFWDYLQEQDLILKSPPVAIVKMETLRHDLRCAQEAHQVDLAIAETKQLLSQAAQVGDANLLQVKEHQLQCTHRIESLTSELVQLRQGHAAYTQYRRQLIEAQELGERIHALAHKHHDLTHQVIDTMWRETINHCVRQLQHALAVKQETLNNALMQKKLVQQFESQIATLTIEEEAAKLLVQQLSPSEGLIAEGLFGFIHHYTSQMNRLISKIWAYPMQVQDCGLSHDGGAELDYRFPLMVNSLDNIVPDVKMASSGQCEIVDVAFKVVAMRHLGLAETPLFLDEFGASLDESHREAATDTIKTLMEQEDFTQLFMVSHYRSSYGAFTNAEVCVIDPTNILVPDSYNHHVFME